ncbi:MAG: heme exporter protein CcmB [Acidiferrobacterales bacterium]|nr:heme exporter protein CcmB [Acidiferrobacterales bacterium]
MIAIVRRDLLISLRTRGDILLPVLFFIVVVSLFPMSVTPVPELLQETGPGIIWVAALLATLLALDGIFRPDYDDGALEQLSLTPHPLSMMVLAKAIAHWLTTGLPLLLVSPLLGVLMQLPYSAIQILFWSLLLGTPALSLIGSVGVGLTVGIRKSGTLLSLLILPLYVPVLIFGTGAVHASIIGLPVTPHLMLLGAFSVFSLAVCPLASAIAIKISVS